MLPPERILFPIDDSPSSLLFAKAVLSLAVKCRASVILLDTSQLNERGHVCNTPMTRFWERAMRDVKIEWKFERGDAATVILRTAAPHDLIMMPFPNAGIFQRWFGKTVIETVLARSSCAVWTGGKPARSAHGAKMKIACAVDLHADSGRVALNAAFLARNLDARLDLVHALPVIDEGIILLAAGGDLPATLNHRVARQELESMLPISQHCGDPLIVKGDTPRAIRKAVGRIGADLLVIGPGRQRPGELKIGAQVLDIVRASPCPVLVLDKEQPRIFQTPELRIDTGDPTEVSSVRDLMAV